MKPEIPVAIKIVQIVAEELNTIRNVFSRRTLEFKQLKEMMKGPLVTNLAENEEFLASKTMIKYTQLLFLLGISMYKGVTAPLLKQISKKDNSIQLIWNGGIKSQLNLGKFDDEYKQFISYYKIKIIGNIKERGFSLSVLKKNYDLIIGYVLSCSLLKQMMEELLTKKKDIKKLLADENNFNFLFILISSLPTEQLNALLIFIQQYFPDNLNIKINNQHINVNNLFQTSSTDAHYLIEKVKIYYELYFSKDYPIIKHITQNKTKEFLAKTMQNKTVFEATGQNMRTLKQNQIELRLGLYNVIVKQMERLIK
jgi:hypothetical protein